MARNKPIPRKVRRDLNSLSIREDYNRANQVRRDKDEIKNLSVSVMDHDSAIMYYFNEVIKPTVVDNKETIKVPVMYASPERWYSIQRQGFLRDKRQKILEKNIQKRQMCRQRINYLIGCNNELMRKLVTLEKKQSGCIPIPVASADCILLE